MEISPTRNALRPCARYVRASLRGSSPRPPTAPLPPSATHSASASRSTLGCSSNSLASSRRKSALRRSQRDSILRTARPGHARHDGAEVELERVGEFRLGRVGRIEQSLRLAVGLDQFDLAVAAARQPQIRERLLVNREIIPSSRHTRATCCRASRDPRPATTRVPARSIRRTCRRRPSCAASA